MIDTEIAIQAKAWVDSLDEKWRVQVLSKRSTSRKHKKRTPVKLRRFVEGVPWAFIKPALDYLISRAPYRGIVANGVDFNMAFRPTLTTWQRDSQSVVLGGRGDPTYTLIQDLIDAEFDDVYTVGSSSSCTERVESSYAWDSELVGELPEPKVGVTYQIAALSRNEDGTFNYAVVKRVALTQHTPEIVSEDNAVRRVTVESWDNVYMNDGRYTDDSGSPISVPAPGIEGGVEVKVPQVSQNPDCTIKIQVVRETAKEVDSKRQTAQTIFEATAEDGMTGRLTPLSDAPPAAGGVIKTHESQQQPDGTHTTLERTQTELPVNNAEVEVARTRKGSRTTTTHRNQSEKPSTVVSAGETVKYRKTPGGLFDVTTSKFAVDTKSSIGSGCKKDAYNHSHTTVIAASGLPSELHVSSGGSNGVVVSRDATIDDDGIAIITMKTDTEVSVKDASCTWQVTPDGSVVSVKDAAQTTKPNAMKFSRDSIGSDCSYTVTPGGRYTVETKTPGASGGSVIVEVSGSAKATETRTTTRSVKESHESVSSNSINVNAARGVYREQVIRVNQLGNVDTTDTTLIEQTQVSGVVYKATPRGIVKTTTTFSDSMTPTSLEKPMGSVTNDLTPGGRYTTSVTSPHVAYVDSSHNSADAFQRETDQVSVSIGYTVPTTTVEAGGGVYRSYDASRDENGFIRTVLRTTREIPGEQVSSVETDLFHKVDRTVTRSAAHPGLLRTKSSSPGDPAPIVKRSVQLTKGGGWDIDLTVDNPTFQTWSDSLDTDLYVMRTFYYRNASAKQRDNVRWTAESEWNQLRSKYAPSGWGFSPRAPTHTKFTPSSSLNAYGGYDGYYAIELSWAAESGGADVDHESDQKEIASWSYKTVSNSFQIGVKTQMTNSTPAVTIQRTIQTKWITEDIYRGWKSYIKSRFGSSNTLFEGSHVSVTPSTGVAHGVRVTDAETRVQVISQSSMTPIRWGN